MRYSKQHKAETRRQIVEAAARLFRQHGYDGVGIDQVMSEVGLTAGGFYSHFPSKEALFAEATTAATEGHRVMVQPPADSPSPISPLRVFINSYLSRTHRDQVETGCPLPLLTPDVARKSDATRVQFEDRLLEMLGELEAQMPEGQMSKSDRAAALLAQCVGGVMLARAVKDETLSVQILKACRKAGVKICEE